MRLQKCRDIYHVYKQISDYSNVHVITGTTYLPQHYLIALKTRVQLLRIP